MIEKSEPSQSHGNVRADADTASLMGVAARRGTSCMLHEIFFQLARIEDIPSA